MPAGAYTSLPSGEGGSVNRVQHPKKNFTKPRRSKGQPQQNRAKVATVLGVETSTSLRSASSKTTYECRNCKKKGHLAAVCWEKLEHKDEPKHEQPHIVLTRRMTMKRLIQCIISAASQPNQ